MKKILYPLLLLLLAGLTDACSPRQKELIIVSTNDLHARFFDSAYVNDAVNPGSLSKVHAYVTSLRETYGKKQVLLLDVGDVLQGDNAAYYYNYKDTSGGQHLMSRIFNYMDYDAAIVGNHDIETGHPVYDRLRDELDCPYLAANAIDSAGNPWFDEYALIHKGGLRIAILGMTNPNIPQWLNPELWSGLTFRPIEEQLQQRIDRLRAQEQPDLLILAIHAGIGKETLSLENPALYLAHHLQGIDAIFAAHDHRQFCEKAGPDSTWVLEGGSRAEYVTQLSVAYTRQGGQNTITRKTAELIPLKEHPSSKEYNQTFADDYQRVKAFTLRPVGSLSCEMDFAQALKGPSLYMNLIHRVQLDATGSDLSISAPLNTQKRIPAGPLNFNDLYQIYPFENQLYQIWMTGAEIKAYLEQSYDNWIAGKGPAYNYDSVAGLIYEVDTRQPLGKRIRIKGLANQHPFDLQHRYTVAINSYRASGAGGLFKLTGLTSSDLEKRISLRLPEIRTLVDEYVSRSGEITPESLLPENLGEWRFIF